MSFKKGQPVVIIFPATQFNSPQIYKGEVSKVQGSQQFPAITVRPLQAGMGYMNFRSTGKGLGNEAFIVEPSFIEWILKIRLTNPENVIQYKHE
jgi:hypothetical protein